MIEPPKTKAEFLAAIAEAKRLNGETLEPLRQFREIADRMLVNPLLTPEDAAMIEQRFEQINEALAANKAVEKQLADMFFEHDIDKLFADEDAGS